jgi:hypothetical protein
VWLQSLEIVYDCCMLRVTLYCGHAVPAYTVTVVSFTWTLAQATFNIAWMMPKVDWHSLRILRCRIEVISIVPITRTWLVVLISTRVIGPVVTIGQSMVASVGPSRGRHEKSHEESVVSTNSAARW